MTVHHLVWSAVLTLALSLPVQAAQGHAPDEIAILPDYCKVKLGRMDGTYWIGQMGDNNWIHMHHYCNGLIELNRYYSGTTGPKKANLRNAAVEFSSMLKGWTPDFYLRPEAHLNRGKALKLMGKVGEAMSDFQKALDLNPRLSTASIELADFYAKLGKREQALTILKQGLEQSPSTKSLRRRYQELGGDLKEIPEVITTPAIEPVKPVQTEPPLVSPKAVEHAVAPVKEQKTGNKTNPWCRFCPENTVQDPVKPKTD